MRQIQKPPETRSMIIVFVTVLVGWVGFSLPYPVFSYLFLIPESPLFGESVTLQTRTLLLGVAIAVYPLGQIIGAPLLGRWSDRYGRRSVLQVALLTAVAGALLLAAGVTFASLPLLFLGRFVAGLGEGNTAILQSLAADVSCPATKARNFAAIGIAMDLGFVAGPVLGGMLADPAFAEALGSGLGIGPDLDLSLALPFWAAVGLFALNLAIVPLFLKDARPALRPAAAEPAVPILRSATAPQVMPLLIISFLSYWSIMIFFDFFPVFFVQLYDTPPRQLGINAALLSVPLIVSGLIVGRIATRFGSLATAMASFLLLFAGIALFIQMTSEGHHILPVILVAIGINFGQTATSVLVSDAAPAQQQGQVMGLYRAITVAAGGLAALVGGSFAALSPQAPFITALVTAGLGLGLIAAWSRRNKRAKSPASQDAGIRGTPN